MKNKLKIAAIVGVVIAGMVIYKKFWDEAEKKKPKPKDKDSKFSASNNWN